MIRVFADGVFPSVTLLNGRGLMAVREGDPRGLGAVIVYEWAGTDVAHARETLRIGLQAGSPCFPNLYAFDGLIWLAYHDGRRQRLRNLSGGQVHDFEGLSNPTAFGGRWFAYTEPAQPYRVFRIDLVTGEVTQPRLGAPTGLARITDDGRVITVDEDRALEGRHTSNPRYAGDLTVYEYDDATRSGCGWEVGAVSGLLWPGLLAFTPDVAREGDRLAICTAGSGSTRLFCGSLAELEPKPDPKPEPPMEVPDKSAFAAAFLGPRLALVGSMEDTRANTFEAVNAGCLELRQSDGQWGLLEKTGGDRVQNRAADIWLYDLGNGTAQVVDVVSNGEGAPNESGVRTAPSPAWSVKDIRPISQWKMPYGAVTNPEPTHAYDGGDNDSGECDVILRTGKCNQPPDAAIHRVAPTPPPIDPPPPVSGVTNEDLMRELRKLSFHLGVR